MELVEKLSLRVPWKAWLALLSCYWSRRTLTPTTWSPEIDSL